MTTSRTLSDATGRSAIHLHPLSLRQSNHALIRFQTPSILGHVFFFFFFFFLFMSDAHHGINSSTQKYQSTQSNVALTSCRQDSGSPPF